MLFLASLLLWWPGIALYDTVGQYRQALSGAYEDWHPPVMAWLWHWLVPLAGGAAAMFVVQEALYWTGLGLIAAALARGGRTRAAIVVLAIGASPLATGWQAAVLKDTQMLGAMLAAVGVVAWWRLAGRRVPKVALAAVIVLLGYAVMVRANAVFAVLPLAAMLSPARPARRIAVVVVGTLALIGATPLVNHELLGATATKIGRTLPIFDLAGIAHFSGPGGVGLPVEERALIAARHCYKPFFWDPLGDDNHCGRVAERLDAVPGMTLDLLWISAIAAHPVGYAEHRLSHLNATDRWIVPAHWPTAAPPQHSEPNDLGLTSPGAVARWIAVAGGWMAETPLGWPIVWIVVSAGVAWIGRRNAAPAGELAMALAASALALEASFAVVSIASDLRYHLWSMVAAALAAVLLAGERPWPRRPTLVIGAVLALVVTSGLIARIVLPAAPTTYQAMLD